MLEEMKMPRECPVHTHPEGPNVLRKVFEGQLSLKDAARQLGVSYSLVWRCYNYHYKMQATDKGTELALKETKEMEDVEYTEDLKEVINKLKKKVNTVLDDPKAKDRPTAWIHQLRGCIKDLAELEGKLQKGPLIQLTQLNIQFERITTFIMSELCEDCKKKVLNFLEKARAVT